MPRGKKRSNAAKRKHRERTPSHSSPATRPDPLMHIVRDFSSAALTADTAVALCVNRLDDGLEDTVIARIAHEVWKDQRGAAVPLAAHLGELFAELRRHQERLRELHDRLAEYVDTDGELPMLPDAEFARALERVVARARSSEEPGE